MFDPKTNKFPYPELTDKHYLVVKKNRGIVFDENYPYVDTSKKYKRGHNAFRFLVRFIGYPIIAIRFALKVKGRKNLKKYKDVLKGGFVSICNHVNMCDYIPITSILGKYDLLYLSWGPNVNGENGKMIRNLGGIPIPDDNFHAKGVCFKQIVEHIKNGGAFHLYPEGSMWEFYQPIRPFKDGAAYFSLKSGKPILPLAYTYRENGWIRKHIFKSIAKFTLNIGEPIYPDLTLPFKEAEAKLTKDAHDAVCKLAGIEPSENIYEPIYNNSTRIDYYTTEYGVGYKKSW